MASYNYADPSQSQPLGDPTIRDPNYPSNKRGPYHIFHEASPYYLFNAARGSNDQGPVDKNFFRSLGDLQLSQNGTDSQPGYTPARNRYADYLGFDPTERASLNPSMLEGFGNPYGMSANPYFGPGSKDPGDPSFFQPIIAARDNALRKVIAQATMAPEGRSSAISDYASRVGGPLLSHDVDVAQGQELAQRNFSDSQRGLRLRNLLETMRGQGAEIYSTQRGLEASSKARAGNRALKKLSPLPEILGGIAGYFNAGAADEGIRESYTRAHEK